MLFIILRNLVNFKSAGKGHFVSENSWLWISRTHADSNSRVTVVTISRHMQGELHAAKLVELQGSFFCGITRIHARDFPSFLSAEAINNEEGTCKIAI